MTRRDLVVLAADKDLEHALRGLLSRHESLPIRQIVFDIFVHPEHDAACARRGVSFLSPLSQRYRYALLIMDHEGSGREKISADDLQEALNQEFRVSAWGERGKAIVLDPELEIWVWSDSPHVDAVAGWADRRPRLRQWLNDHGLWDDQESKPRRPKEAFHAALHASGVARSASLYQQLAERVSLNRCGDRSFHDLRAILREWFPRQRTEGT